LQGAKRSLSADRLRYFEQKFPHSGFESNSQRAHAIVSDINSMLPSEDTAILLQASAIGWCLSMAGSWNDLFQQEFALDERLDAMWNRAFKRLIQTKSMKQMLGQTGATQTENRSANVVKLNRGR
jgi:hypothetical protein